MANTRIEKMEQRQMDEAWEMNPHVNPIDNETRDTINRHKAILLNNSDDFVQYIHHVENARISQIEKRIHEEKLKDFAKVEELNSDDGDSTCRSHALQINSNLKEVSADIQEAIDLEDADKVTDLREFAKTSQTLKSDSNRFTCILGKSAMKQPSQKRLYLQALPLYIEERKKAKDIAIQQSIRKQDQSTQDEFRKLQGFTDPTSIYTADQIALFQKEKCPPRRFDAALDPEQQKKALTRNKDYQQMFIQMRGQKKQYLDRLNASEMYRNTGPTGSNVLLSPSQAYQTQQNKYQFCSSGNKESQRHMNQEMVKRDILSRKESFSNMLSRSEMKRSKSNMLTTTQTRPSRQQSNVSTVKQTRQSNLSGLGSARAKNLNSNSQIGLFEGQGSTQFLSTSFVDETARNASYSQLSLLKNKNTGATTGMRSRNNNMGGFQAYGGQPLLINDSSNVNLYATSNQSTRQIPTSQLRPYGHSSGYGINGSRTEKLQSRQTSTQRVRQQQMAPNGFKTQSGWISIKKESTVEDTQELETLNEQQILQVQTQDLLNQSLERTNNRSTFSRSTLANRKNYVTAAEKSKQNQMLKPYQGLANSYLDKIQSGTQADWNTKRLPLLKEPKLLVKESNVSYAKMQLKASNWVEPDFKVAYELKIPDALKSRVNRAYETFTQDCLAELEPVKKLKVGEYQGAVSKNAKNGQGMLKMANGDIYMGNFKNDLRHGTGFCQFKSGALYRGEWKEDKPHGQGILYSGKNEIVECRFEAGGVPMNGRVKIMLQDGSYYEGNYSNHKRHGQGTCWYSNGEMFEGQWNNDKRISRGKMRFNNGTFYHGQFILDKADGSGQIEDKEGNFFQAEQGEEEDGKDSGCILNGRLQHRCSVTFINGDKFIGMFKDGRPNGYGSVHYKNSIKGSSGSEFEQAQYHGEFRQGKRDGKGKMIWADGTVFEGLWKNDMRHHGTQIMSNGWVYKGSFKNDKFDGSDETLMMANMVIYQGKITANKTHPLSLLLYPDGDTYYGQHAQFVKNGTGKLIKFHGGFYECSWEADKHTGKRARIYDDITGDLFVGSLEEGKKNGHGRLYDAERDEVYEGEFENDKRQGEGIIYKRNGEVFKGDFRQNYMEGPIDLIATYKKPQIDKVFNNAQRQGNFYVTVNKKNQEKVRQMLEETANQTNGFKSMGKSKPRITVN